MVEMLIRDFASCYRDDSLFPFLRNYDIYECHSWSDGLADSWDGNNQESTSEAINAWAGIFLWGIATGNNTYRDLGIFGYLNEVYSTFEYWFDRDEDIFNSSYKENYNMASRVFGSKYDHVVWWNETNPQPEEIHGIQYIPITPASLYLAYDIEYAQKDYDTIVSENGGVEDNWIEVIWKFQSLFAPETVINKYDDTISLNERNTLAEVYYFIYSMKSLGNIETSIYADIPSFNVFKKNNLVTYAAYNPYKETKKVNFYRFSDNEYLGYLLIPPNTLFASKTLLQGEINEVSPNVIVFPNPCYLNKGEKVNFLYIPSDSKLKIYTISGELVFKQENINSGQFVWNGRNLSSNEVAAGIYIYYLKGMDYKKTGKISILK